MVWPITPFIGASIKQSILRVFALVCLAVLVISASPGRAGASAATLNLGKPGTVYSYVTSYGTVEVPYTQNVTLLNRPTGLFLDGSETLFVNEERGYRIVRSDPGFNPIGLTGNSYTTDNTFTSPQDMAKDNNGFLWVADGSRVVQYDVSGVDAVYKQNYPVESPWYPGSSIDRLDGAMGVAFDHLTGQNQHMFVSDSNNQRVQVFGFDTAGKPVYVNTIGETGVSGSGYFDNTHFNQPARIAVDLSNRLLVADSGNSRIQRCSTSDDWAHWTCETFDMGSLIALNYPLGVSVAANGNVLVADSGHRRVWRCTDSGACVIAVFGIDTLNWFIDVEQKANGDILVSDWTSNVVRRYNAAGQEQPIYMGQLNVPYTTNPGLLNTPRGITVGPDGSIYILEEYGYRLVKLSAAGQQLMTIGTPGVTISTNSGFGTSFGNSQAGLEGNPAVDSAGRIYVADTSNHRVQVFNADGSFYNRIGVTGYSGPENTNLSCPTTVAINPANGDVLVADKCNQRIQVFAAGTLAYKTTLGQTGVSNIDDMHFNNPWGLAVDASGAVFVADSDNFRVQKCTYTASSYTCATFAGEIGLSSIDFAHLHPISVAVDGSGHVFAADDWNNRVQVFDSTGAYLTTINGAWGNFTTDLRSVSSVAVDKAGKVYLTDKINARVLVFAPGGSGSWFQTNINSFGDVSNNGVWSLGRFNNNLYAGTYNSFNGAEMYRQTAPGQWEPVGLGGLGDHENQAIDHLLEYGGKLYASTLNATPDNKSEGAQIWRSDTGDMGSWSAVVTGGSGTTTPDPANGEFYRLFVFNNQICAATWAAAEVYEGVTTHGAEIWCSSSGDANTWTRLASNGLGNANNIGIMDVQSHNGKLYAGTYNYVDGTNIYSSTNGSAWTPLFDEGGWGDSSNIATTALEEFNGWLYFLFANFNHYGVTIGRCQVCDGADMQEITGSFNNLNTMGMSGLEVHDGALYMVTSSARTGLRVWKSTDGDNWNVVAPVGFGDPGRAYTYWDNGFLSAGGELYLGVNSRGGLGQVWQLGKSTFLPITLH